MTPTAFSSHHLSFSYSRILSSAVSTICAGVIFPAASCGRHSPDRLFLKDGVPFHLIVRNDLRIVIVGIYIILKELADFSASVLVHQLFLLFQIEFRAKFQKIQPLLL